MSDCTRSDTAQQYVICEFHDPSSQAETRPVLGRTRGKYRNTTEKSSRSPQHFAAAHKNDMLPEGWLNTQSRRLKMACHHSLCYAEVS